MIFFLPTPTLLFGRYPLDPPQVYCISQIKTIDIMARGVCGEGGGGDPPSRGWEEVALLLPELTRVTLPKDSDNNKNLGNQEFPVRSLPKQRRWRVDDQRLKTTIAWWLGLKKLNDNLRNGWRALGRRIGRSG
jgi:hypothetical protein